MFHICIIALGISLQESLVWSSVEKVADWWINYLRPDLNRGNHTPLGIAVIIELYRDVGNIWAQIAKYLPGRTENEIKNYWHSNINKLFRARQKQIYSQHRMFLPKFAHFSATISLHSVLPQNNLIQNDPHNQIWVLDPAVPFKSLGPGSKLDDVILILPLLFTYPSHITPSVYLTLSTQSISPKTFSMLRLQRIRFPDDPYNRICIENPPALTENFGSIGSKLDMGCSTESRIIGTPTSRKCLGLVRSKSIFSMPPVNNDDSRQSPHRQF